jgi:thiol-disulfide isomerase/thioredoxin
MSRVLALLAFALSLAVPAVAQAPANAGTKSPVRAAFDTYLEKYAQYEVANKDAASRARTAPDAEKQEMAAKIGALRKQVTESQQTFVKLFTASDWQKIDPVADAPMLKYGLPVVIKDEKTTPAQNVAACEIFLANFGKEPFSRMVRTTALPNALVAAGRVPDAITRLQKDAESATGRDKSPFLLMLGDLHCSLGALSEAAKCYAAVKADANTDSGSKLAVELRSALVGKPAPELDCKTWIGGTATPLAKLQGKVVVVNFWASWYPPCRPVIQALDKLALEHKDDLVVLGVTRFYDHGNLPASAGEIREIGLAVKNIKPEEFPAHIEMFKKNTGVAYAFAIGDEKDFKTFQATNIPLIVVVGKDGVVQFVAAGNGNEALTRATVEHLLAGK